jgi:hypothetical protein
VGADLPISGFMHIFAFSLGFPIIYRFFRMCDKAKQQNLFAVLLCRTFFSESAAKVFLNYA